MRVANLPVFETDERAKAEPDFVSRFRSRAERRKRQLDAKRRVPFYRWEVVHEDGRYAVVAFQNRAVPPEQSTNAQDEGGER